MLNNIAKPILKWAGGKTPMLGDLLPKVPKSYGRYIEPFFGGGAMFFALQPENAIISDSNPAAVIFHQEVEEIVHGDEAPDGDGGLAVTQLQVAGEEHVGEAVRGLDDDLEGVVTGSGQGGVGHDEASRTATFELVCQQAEGIGISFEVC